MATLATKKQKKNDFDSKQFLSTIGAGRTMLSVAKKKVVYAQGDSCEAVFFIQAAE